MFAADCCGRFYESAGIATLAEAKAHAAEIRARHPKAFVAVERPYNIDLGCADGLTGEEREFLGGRECDCGDPDCSAPHACEECGYELPLGEVGVCRSCYRADPSNFVQDEGGWL